ncbi:hypothetical protein C357_18192, partial [Citreicella sp. 357]
AGLPGLLAIGVGLMLGLVRALPRLRLGGAVLGLAGAVWLLAAGGPSLLEGADQYARVSPGAGFWGLLAVFVLLMADALAQLNPGPAARAGLLGLGLAGLRSCLGPARWRICRSRRNSRAAATPSWRRRCAILRWPLALWRPPR